MRIKQHPILSIGRKEALTFFWNNQAIRAQKGEVLSSALFAAGIRVFGSHQKDGRPQGMFCANGQCSQCTVIADGIPVKACVTEVFEQMRVTSCDGLPALRETVVDSPDSVRFREIREISVPVLIIGGGPAGLRAAIELASLGIQSLIVDDKSSLGGKLVLQTHMFFGSIEDCYAGTRGVDIAIRLENEINQKNELKKEISVMTNAQAVAVYADRRVGVVQYEKYFLIKPEALLVATGAREKVLSFPGCDLPGVYGAGAFQTLVNRDLVRAGDKIFIVGGGNVGLIAAYHALQAGMTVVGVIEALPRVSGYKVHQDKILRLGVPLLLSHTVLSAHAGQDGKKLQSATIAGVDGAFQRVAGTEKKVDCDTLLVAAGLSSCNEFYLQAQEYGMRAYVAGDAEEIAEASAAMFSGRIVALKIARDFGKEVSIPEEYTKKLNILKSKPGKISSRIQLDQKTKKLDVYPIFNCYEEIPCNPCVSVCSRKFIKLKGETGTIMDLPYFDGEGCSGCLKCSAICPGLAITIVDKRKVEPGWADVYLSFELIPSFKAGDEVELLDCDGKDLESARVLDIINRKWQDKTLLIKFRVSEKNADQVAGLRVQNVSQHVRPGEPEMNDPGENIICRCEKVKDQEIRAMIRSGTRDFNELKVLRCMMGACGAKSCTQLIQKIFKQEGVALSRVKEGVKRPLFAEVKFSTFAGLETEKEPDYESDI